MGEVELLSRLAVALAIGLLVGLERGWHSRAEEEGRRAAGFRTFALSGLLGGVSGAIAGATDPVVLGFLFIGYTAAFAAFHWLEAGVNKDLGATSVVAGMLTFALGAYALIGDLRVAVACAVAMALLLALREPLHRWVASLRWEEIRAVLILLAMSFLLLPVLPNRTVDPWDSINPTQIWLLAIMMAAISFGGYVAVRLFGDRLGVVMAAVAGGLASSTATTLTLARLGRERPGSDRLLAGGILAAGVVMVVRVGVVATLLNWALLVPLLFPLAAAAVVLGLAAAFFLIGSGKAEHPDLNITNPRVRDEIVKAMGFWLELGISGFRVDAVPFMIETTGVDQAELDRFPDPHEFLRDLRSFVGRRTGDGILLGEVNLPHRDQKTFFGGKDGDELTMQFDCQTGLPRGFARLACQIFKVGRGGLRISCAAYALHPSCSRKLVSVRRFRAGHNEEVLGELTMS